MLTLMKVEIFHRCENCEGHWDVHDTGFATYLEAQESMKAGLLLAADMGYELLHQRPDRAELERTEGDVFNELQISLRADPVAAN